MYSKIVLLPVAPVILPCNEPFAGGNIDCSEIGQPRPNHYGAPPDFAQLDANSDGVISREEAEAYMPLFTDFEYLAHHTDRISKDQFENWVRTQGY